MNNGKQMQELKKFIFSLPLDERENFAKRCNTTLAYLKKAIYRNHELGPELSVLIEQNSINQVTRQMLHPSSYWKKWPELSETDN